MKVLVLNAGSSSLKYQFLNTEDESIMAKGVIEKIGLESSMIGYTNGNHKKVSLEKPLKNHDEALQVVFDSLVKGDQAILSSLDEIDAVGHRAVHGGDLYSDAALVTDKVLADLDALCELAPLHNPANIMGIRACQKIVPQTPQVVVFDTAFHQTMKPVAYMYPIPYKYYENYKIRRYGFHGTSYAYVTPKACEFLGTKVEETNLVICHIGNGASITAVRNGKCVDTSMGFTPLEGLMMGTRCGRIDSAIIPYVMEKESISSDEVLRILNEESGLKGISGVSSDMRDVEKAAAEGNERAVLAVAMLAHTIRKTIGSCLVTLDGKVDAIVFTAGMGEFDTSLRETVTKNLESLGIEIDVAKNAACRSALEDVSTPNSRTKILVVPTNEELMIARETEQLLTSKK